MQNELDNQAKRMRDQNKNILKLKSDLNDKESEIQNRDPENFVQIQIGKKRSSPNDDEEEGYKNSMKKALESENQFLKDAADNKNKQFDEIERINEQLKKALKEREDEILKKDGKMEKLKKDLLLAKEDGLEKKVAQEHADKNLELEKFQGKTCLLYTSPSPRDGLLSRMPSSA